MPTAKERHDAVLDLICLAGDRDGIALFDEVLTNAQTHFSASINKTVQLLLHPDATPTDTSLSSLENLINSLICFEKYLADKYPEAPLGGLSGVSFPRVMTASDVEAVDEWAGRLLSEIFQGRRL
jgi:hypothetical protein